jgi:hypothetical protein
MSMDGWTRHAFTLGICIVVGLTGCDPHTSLVGQHGVLCKAARDAGATIENFWKAYGGDFGYACVADEEFLGGKGGDLGLYTKVGFMITGHDEARMDRIDIYVDQGNPDTAGQGATLLVRRVEAFFKQINTPLPSGVLEKDLGNAVGSGDPAAIALDAGGIAVGVTSTTLTGIGGAVHTVCNWVAGLFGGHC